MRIIKQFGINGDKRTLYNMTQVQEGSIADHVGERVQIAAYVLYEMEGRDGDEVVILKVLTRDGKILGTVSAAFIRGFCDFLDVMESDEIADFEIVQKTSKAGRKYIAFKA